MKRELRRPKVEVWKSKANGHYFWRLRASNNRTIAVGGECYASKRNCLQAVDRVVKALGGDVERVWVVIL